MGGINVGYTNKPNNSLTFGTALHPLLINPHYMYAFRVGQPTCFIVRSPEDGRWYINLKPISTVSGIQRFYHEISHKNLGPILYTHSEKYLINNSGKIRRIPK